MKNNYNCLAKYITEYYAKSISGTDVEDGETIIGESPSEKVMVGMLAEDRIEESLDGAYRENTATKFESVPSISVSFILSKASKGAIYIRPNATLFYQVKPVYEETCGYLLKKYSGRDKKEYKSIQELIKAYPGERIPFPGFYKKIELKNYLGDGIKLDVKELLQKEHSMEDELALYFQAIADQIMEEIYLLQDGNLSLRDLNTVEDFNRAAARKQIQIRPRWRIDLLCNCTEMPDCIYCTVQMVNRTPVDGKLKLGYIPKLFNAELQIQGESEVHFMSIEPEYFKRGYKKKKPIYALAENTSARFQQKENAIITENIPVYYQYRMYTKDQFNHYITFEALDRQPVKNLKKIYKQMLVDLDRLSGEYNLAQESMGSFAKKQYKEALEHYKQEIGRFQTGIEQIEYKEYVGRAFRRMNQAFGLTMDGDTRKMEGWRLFQIVFIVSLIGDVIRSEYKEDEGLRSADLEIADLLYFPTGGGKTEAFLGITVFTMFFDRFRGKNQGVTSIIKYPLRLLAVQQLDRILTMVIKANRILEEEEKTEYTPFSLGFYVGKDNTPNKISPMEKLSSRGKRGAECSIILESDEETLNEYYRFIDTCPCCGKRKVNVRFDKTAWKLAYYCDQEDCRITELPLSVVDNEIYRFMPSIVVSTIDKMAMVGISQDFKMLFGQVQYRCPRHGYSYKKNCLCGDPECSCGMEPVSKLKDPVPSLFIQDELHLVKESLGTFASHYETFLDYYAKALVPEEQRKNIRFIGATATIAMYQRHIQNLYHKEARRFPCEYPSVEPGEDFYSYTDKKDITRIIMGYAPYGRSLTDGVWESVYRMRLTVFDLFERMDFHYKELQKRGFDGGKEILSEMLYDYWIELIYNNRKQDAMELENSFQNQANNKLEELGAPKFAIRQMTSDTDFQTVRKTLFDIKENRKNKEHTNLLLATSTISHGVDEDAFNIMYFYGMPNHNAEYIQAYSRTGRKYTGIVIDIIRLMRQRDRSYLKNFTVFHENRDDLVESVPLNRWAKHAIYSTLPGLLSGLLFQYYAPLCKEDSFYSALNVQRYLKKGVINIEEAAEHMVNAYGCNDQERLSFLYRDIIREEVCRILEELKNTSLIGDKMLPEAIGQFSYGQKRPMRSLRDTEEQLEIQI